MSSGQQPGGQLRRILVQPRRDNAARQSVPGRRVRMAVTYPSSRLQPFVMQGGFSHAIEEYIEGLLCQSQ